MRKGYSLYPKQSGRHYGKGIIFISRTVRPPLWERDNLVRAAAVGFSFRKGQNPCRFCFKQCNLWLYELGRVELLYVLLHVFSVGDSIWSKDVKAISTAICFQPPLFPFLIFFDSFIVPFFKKIFGRLYTIIDLDGILELISMAHVPWGLILLIYPKSERCTRPDTLNSDSTGNGRLHLKKKDLLYSVGTRHGNAGTEMTDLTFV